MNRTFDKPGFVIFSNSDEYGFEVLRSYFLHDAYPENIVFVHSRKSPVSPKYIERLSAFGRLLVVVPFEDYNKIEYASAVESLDLSKTVMIIKDLRFMLKRLDERLSMMQIKHACYKKIVIDSVPFISDVWKIYYPYSFFDKTLLGYSHSYAFEAAIRNYENDLSLENPCDPVKLAQKIFPATFINYKRLFLFELKFETYLASSDELIEYESLKEKLFISENSIKKVISKLRKYASSLMKGYNVPIKLDGVYDWSDFEVVTIYRTNFKVDEYLCAELVSFVNNMNTLVSGLYGD